jgi:hypothetical protein
LKKTVLYSALAVAILLLSGSRVKDNSIQRKAEAFFKENPAASYLDTIAGDFNGDTQSESAWIKKTSKDNLGELAIRNRCTVLFSNEKITTLDTELYCLFGNLWNVEDLDGDGADELALVIYNEREWSQCFVFSFKKHGWYLMTEPFYLWGGVEEKKIQRDPDKKGHILIRELVIKNDSLKPQIRSVKVY